MDRDTAKNIILASLPHYLAQKGINYNQKFLCLNPEHNDNSPSMVFDKRRNKCHCFACGKDVDIFDIIGWDYNTSSFAEAFEIGCDLFNLDLDSKSKSKKHIELKIKPVTQIVHHKQDEQKKVAVDVYDKVYRTLKKLMPLTKEDIEYLKNVRGLTEDRIQADYLRMKFLPEERKSIIMKLKKLTGYANDVLQYVPGFFLDKTTGQLDYAGSPDFDITGIGILIHNVQGKVCAIQIRRDTSKKGNRYCWFTSRFAQENPLYDGGSSPGAAKDILIPDNPKNCLCITEGRFKSEILAQNQNIVISIQGVYSWKGIDETIQEIQSKHEIHSIFLMFDSDIMGNRQVFNAISGMTKVLQEKMPEIKLYFGIWQLKNGKGIDDCILNGNKKSVKFIEANLFMQISEQTFQELLKDTSFQKMNTQERNNFAAQLQQEIESKLFITTLDTPLEAA